MSHHACEIFQQSAVESLFFMYHSLLFDFHVSVAMHLFMFPNAAQAKTPAGRAVAIPLVVLAGGKPCLCRSTLSQLLHKYHGVASKAFEQAAASLRSASSWCTIGYDSAGERRLLKRLRRCGALHPRTSSATLWSAAHVDGLLQLLGRQHECAYIGAALRAGRPAGAAAAALSPAGAATAALGPAGAAAAEGPAPASGGNAGGNGVRDGVAGCQPLRQHTAAEASPQGTSRREGAPCGNGAPCDDIPSRREGAPSDQGRSCNDGTSFDEDVSSDGGETCDEGTVSEGRAPRDDDEDTASIDTLELLRGEVIDSARGVSAALRAAQATEAAAAAADAAAAANDGATTSNPGGAAAAATGSQRSRARRRPPHGEAVWNERFAALTAALTFAVQTFEALDEQAPALVKQRLCRQMLLLNERVQQYEHEQR